jgi:hypothetical protein
MYGIYVAFDEQLCFMMFRMTVGNDSSFVYFIPYVVYSEVFTHL